MKKTATLKNVLVANRSESCYIFGRILQNMKSQPFDPNFITRHQRPRSHIGVGNLAEIVGQDILKTYENFDKVIKPEVSFRGQPFDRLCKKAGKWYIVEIKGASHGFNGTPSHTQKERMRKVLKEVKGLEPAFLQIDLGAAKYKVRYGTEVEALIGKKKLIPQKISPIIDWVKDTISKSQ